MIRTLVCQREGCSGNQFYIESTENKIKAICRECKNVSEFDMDNYGLKVISSCSACKNDLFKLFHETETGKIYAKCSKWHAEYVYGLLNHFVSVFAFRKIFRIDGYFCWSFFDFIKRFLY